MNAVYKIYNSDTQQWVEYYFKTKASQVVQSQNLQFISAETKINSQKFNMTVTNGVAKAEMTLTGDHIQTGVLVSDTYYYFNAGVTIREALCKITQKINAIDTGTANCLTVGNYAKTLNSVYQAKDDDLTNIAALTGGGFLKRNSNNTWTLDDSTYVPTGRKIGTHTLDQDIVLYGSEIAMASNNQTTVKDAIDSLASVANGIARTYAIDELETNSNNSNCKNSRFNFTSDELAINTIGDTEYIYDFHQRKIYFKDLKLGDTVYVKGTNLPDRWLAAKIDAGNGKYNYKFFKLETYNMAWDAISGKPTLSITGTTITIGSNSVFVPQLSGNGSSINAARADHTHSDYVPFSNANRDVNLNYHALKGITELMFGSDGENSPHARIYTDEDGIYFNTISYGNGHLTIEAVGDVMLTKYDSYTEKTTYETLATKEWVSSVTHKVFVQSNTPTDYNSGDIWIDTTGN